MYTKFVCDREYARTVVTDESTYALCLPERKRNRGISSVVKQILRAAMLIFPPKQSHAQEAEDNHGQQEKQNYVCDRA